MLNLDSAFRDESFGMLRPMVWTKKTFFFGVTSITVFLVGAAQRF